MKNWLAHDLSLKIVALLLATATWFFVHSMTSDSRTVEAPLEVRLKTGLSLLHASTQTVQVNIRGTREDVREASRQEITALVDLTKSERTGEFVVPLNRRMIRHPYRVQVVEIAPAEITVRVDQIVERDFAVQPQFFGELPPGLIVERVIVKPETVRLKAPKLVADSMTGAKTLPIDLTGRRTSFRERVEIESVDSHSKTPQRRFVDVNVRIVEARAVDTPAGGG